MIKNINIFYDSSYSNICDKIYYLFNSIGINVIRHNLSKNIMLTENIKFLQEKLQMKSINFDNDDSVNIYLSNKNSIESNTNTIIINTEQIDQSNIIEFITKWLYDNNYINENEEKDLFFIDKFCCDKELYELLPLTENRFLYDCDKTDILTTKIDELVSSSSDIFIDWGNKEHEFLQYFNLYLSIHGNIYSLKVSGRYIYDAVALLKLCERFINKQYKYYKSFILLVGEINFYFLQECNEAYKCFEMQEKNNYYVSYLKGFYCYDFAIRDDMASKFYLKSILIYPEYYQVWYLLGCVLRNEKDRSALIAFKTVLIILEDKMNSKCLNSNEYYCLFNSCTNYASIQSKTGKFNDAMGKYLLAERLWYGIDNSNLLSDSQKVLKKKLNIKNVYSELEFLYNKVGDKASMSYYNSKLYKYEMLMENNTRKIQ